MTAGVHCAHFEMRELGTWATFVGVVGPGFDPAAGGEAKESAEGWMMYTDNGKLFQGGSGSEWAGRPGGSRLATWWCGARPALRRAVGVLRGWRVRAGHGARPRRRQVGRTHCPRRH